jgi:glycogen synthase
MTSTILLAAKTTIRPKKSAPTPEFHIMTVAPLTKRNASDHIFQALEAMCEMNFLVSVIAEGDEEAQEQCFELVEKYPQNFAIHEATDQNRHSLYKDAHVVLIPTKPNKQLRAEIIKHKIVPILPHNSGFEDFNAQKEHGHGFTFQKGNFWQMLCAVMRASENQKFKYDWKVLQKNLSRLV